MRPANCEIGDWYWLVDEKDNLIRVCKSMSFNDSLSSSSCPLSSSNNQDILQHIQESSQSIFDYFDGDDINSLYRDIHAIIRSGKKKRIAFVWRFDTPSASHDMYMVISSFPQNKNFLLYHSIVLRTIPSIVLRTIPQNVTHHGRPPSIKLNDKTLVDINVALCNFCVRVRTPGSHSIRSLSDYVRGGSENVTLCRFICPDCRRRFDKILHGENKSTSIDTTSTTTTTTTEPTSSSPFTQTDDKTQPISTSDDSNQKTEEAGESQQFLSTNYSMKKQSHSVPHVMSEFSQQEQTTAGLALVTITNIQAETPASAPASLDSSPDMSSQSRENDKNVRKSSLQAQAAGLEGLKILFVDDSRLNQCILGRMMKRAGMDMSVASNGVDAVTMMRDKVEEGVPYDLILMDCVMPGELDGYGATSKIREFSQVPIIAATGVPKGTWEVSYKPSGMNDYLPKPFNIKDVLVLIRKWSSR